MPVKLKLPNGMRGWISRVPDEIDHTKVYLPVCAINYLLKQISVQYGIDEEIKTLFTKFPSVDPIAMAFVNFWDAEELWNS